MIREAAGRPAEKRKDRIADAVTRNRLAIATAVESELERELSASIMREGAKLERRKLDAAG